MTVPAGRQRWEESAQVLTPGILRLPFWLFNFEEIVDAFFGGRAGVDEEVQVLQEVIPLAKVAYLQYRANTDRLFAKKGNARARLYGGHAGAISH